MINMSFRSIGKMSYLLYCALTNRLTSGKKIKIDNMAHTIGQGKLQIDQR